MMFLQARYIQQCVYAHDKCKEKEVLRNEFETKDGANNMNRLIINNEYVQSLDKSDGSLPYDVDIKTNETDHV